MHLVGCFIRKMSFPFYLFSSNQRTQKNAVAQIVVGTNFVGFQYGNCHSEVAHRFLEKLCTPEQNSLRSNKQALH
jgi:hypothetical protein